LGLGCGSAIKNTAIAQGNWAFTATSTTAVKAIATPTFVLGGNLAQNGANLTGSMYINNSGCIPDQFVSFTGTVKDKNVTLTSENFGGQVITVTAAATTNSMTGTYAVTGECADSGTVTANAVPSISGTWTGTLSNPTEGSGGLGVAQATLSLALSQAATASEDGTFALSGTLTYNNSPCSVSGSITNGYLAGNLINIVASTNDIDGTGTVYYQFVHLDSVTAPHSMTGSYEVSSTTLCDGQIVDPFTLTKQ
jgi:hypothetical protein